jgi:LPXTG-motif cell wall-anchored protein
MSTLRRIVAVGLPTAGLTVFTALALSGSPATAGPEMAYPAVAVTPTVTADSDGYGNAEPDATVEPTDDTPTRGNGGYGSVSPSTAPTPSASVDTVPPGVSPSSATPSAAATTPGGGVSAGHALPVTGAPAGALVSFGALLVAAGVGSVWYTRRRRSA